MKYPLNPKRGQRLPLYCIACEKECEHIITGIKRNSVNDDGSICSTIKATCQKCGYLRGEYKPVWYNLYHAGCIID